MASPVPVADEVLSWLYRSLGHYRDADRTYSDVARALSQFYSTLSPCTENYTDEQGSTALLLKLKGTLPVYFLGSAYRLPISIWIPQYYPHEPPIIFFNPNKNLVVRPNQHVSVEGKVYHPYLAQWPNHSGRSNLVDCLSILQDVFGKEPPLIARQSQGPESAGPEVPRYASLPRFTRPQSGADAVSALPPPPPPKPPEVRPPLSLSLRNGTIAQTIRTAPLLPPKPAAEVTAPLRVMQGSQPARLAPTRSLQHYDQDSGHTFFPENNNHVQHAGAPPVAGLPAAIRPFSNQMAPLHQRRSSVDVFVASNLESRPTGISKAPVQDLMSMPSEMNLPSEASAMSALDAPPIPPNPEKDALMIAISAALRTRLEHSIAQNTAAIPALEAQQRALEQAMRNMQHETYQLNELSKMLTANEAILHDSMLEADRVVSGTADKQPPPVDDILVAPTLVSEQLYKLVADERGIGEVLFALTKAIDKGRISSDVFIRQTRSLAREQFLQKALIKKIAQGMGLMAW